MPSKRIVRPFDSHGCITQFHNALLDSVMPNVSPNAWKILCLIIRQTVGWQREDAGISYPAIQAATGIKSRSTVSESIKELESLKLIERGRADEQSEMSYRLNYSIEIEWQPQRADAEPVQKLNAPPFKNRTEKRSKNEPAPSSKNERHIRKETKNTWKQGEASEGLDLTGQQKPAALDLKTAPFFEPDPAEKQVETYTPLERVILAATGRTKPRNSRDEDTLRGQALTLQAEGVTAQEAEEFVKAQSGKAIPFAFFADRMLESRAAKKRLASAPNSPPAFRNQREIDAYWNDGRRGKFVQ